MTFKSLRDRTHTITLAWPFEFGARVVDTLKFRRPLPPDLRRLADGGGTDSDRSLRLIADLAEQEPALIDCLDPEDLGQINAWLEPILDPKGRPSGAPGS